MKEKDQRSRWEIYVLLAVVILSGLGLSAFMARKAEEVRGAVTPLLNERIPMFEHLAEFEHSLLLYQLALNKYAVQSIDLERFRFLESQRHEDLEKSLEQLRQDFSGGPYIENIQAAYSALIPLAAQLDLELRHNDYASSATRKLLLDVNRYTNDIRGQLALLKQGTATGLDQEAIITHMGIESMSNLVQAYTLLTLLASLFVMYHVHARMRSEKQLAFQASHDPLTDLANRRSFERRLRALPNTRCALVLVMVDRFDRVVGGLGYAFADKLMVEIAQRIKDAAERHGGEVFRLDGATLAILYPRAGRDTQAHRLDALDTLLDDMRRPFRFGPHEVFPSLSMGSVSYPDESGNAAELLQKADAALRAAREAGGDTFVPYSEAISQKTQHSLHWEAQLAHAIERSELLLYYQPQQQLKSGKLAGFEALLRWQHDGKLISPADFIPLAEETGLIVPIGDWVLTQACLQARRWQECFPHLEHVIAVNISPRQFAHPDFLRKLTDILDQTGVDPTRIKIEITESTVMQDAVHTNRMLHALRDRGLKLAIDDFGTGYSSLAYLQRFPVDTLKIDQSFIRDLQSEGSDAVIVQTMLNMARHLGLNVIAEGVENQQQREWLQAWGCDEIQGYWYGRPMPAPDATGFIRQTLMPQPAQA